ncbi:hypothetical protein [Salmonirosea aquatica]|uniref:Glycosyltransferase family 1 protein n=1 Tax=Salmonirosea aquatica TaxID=2654236 RepID=A0A7C9FC92_9BACT|nr:hypothetical protein [Cytophagaceae bacterium SJW1-29]
MKIGVLAQYLDTRSDVREMLQILAKNHRLIVYLKASDSFRIAPILPTEVEVTVIPPTTSFLTKLLLIFWQYIYLVFGKIPRSRYNYYMVEHIRLSDRNMGHLARYTHAFLVGLSKYVPHFISYDTYLQGLAWLPKPLPLDSDIEVFFCNTQIYDDRLYAHILNQNKPVWTYVYSWDHPCKMKTFSTRTRYLVWNEGLREDLTQLQRVPLSQIILWGATQFSYVQAHLHRDGFQESPYPFPYVYLGFATGYDELVAQEVKYVVSIARVLAKVLPEWKLVVRPYPFQKQWNLYASLRDRDNVVFDDQFRTTSQSFSVEYDGVQDKLWKMQHARAFLHFGTTMGYEACYFDIPSCLMAFVPPHLDSLLHGFVHQYQNGKYLHQTDFPNVVINSEQLEPLFELIANSPEQLLKYNEKIRQLTPLRSLEAMSRELLMMFEPEVKSPSP